MTEGARIVQIAGEWTAWRRPAGDPPGPPVLLIHGLTGDERSMAVFAGAFPSGSLLLAPRAPHAYQGGGFSWTVSDGWPAWGDLAPAAEALAALIGSNDRRPWLVAGFSQGAAAALALAARGGPLAGVAALAGFLPEGDLPAGAWRGLRVFWGHGTLDEHVPIERARRGVRALEQAGARVELCETEVDHRLGAACLRALRGWAGGR